MYIYHNMHLHDLITDDYHPDFIHNMKMVEDIGVGF